MLEEAENYKSQRHNSQYQALMFEGPAVSGRSYQNLGALISRVIVLCFSTFYFGYCLTYLSTFSKVTVNEAYGEKATTSSFQGILIGALPVGAIFGAGTAPFLLKLFSRKHFILVVNVLALVIEGVIQVSNVYVLLICRIFQGIFVGYYMSIVPIYINQLSPKQIVGSFGVFTQLFVVVGIIISYGIGLIMQKTNVQPVAFYHVMVSVNALLVVLQSLLLLVGYIPESPNSLIRKNKNEEAMRVIEEFTVASHVEEVFKHKQLQVEHEMREEEAKGDEEQEKQRIVYSFKAYLLGFQLPFMQQLTGINAIVTQANNLVSKVIPDLSDYCGLTINVLQFLATFCTIYVLTKVGRKSLTLFGNLALGLIDIAIGILFIFDKSTAYGYTIFGLLILYNIIYGISLGPVVWLYVPEIIPAKIVPLATMMNWIGCSICVVFMPIAIDANDGNPYPVFLFFGAITLVFFLVNVMTMIETKGLSVKQIAKKFHEQ